MGIQNEFYRHVTSGDPGEATQLLALMALHLAHDRRIYPMSLHEVAAIAGCRRDPRLSCLNQLMAADFIREALFSKLRPWLPPEVEQLRLMSEHGGYEYGDAMSRLVGRGASPSTASAV